MRIAILGATSEIARDLIASFAAQAKHDLMLFARRPPAVTEWLQAAGLTGRYPISEFDTFDHSGPFDAILNFVGVGNPAQAIVMGASIFDVTLEYDQLAINYLSRYPDCRYIFLSSGAAYGSSFDKPVDAGSSAIIEINHLRQTDWYTAAKLHAECRHRALQNLHIIDVRVFSYFSHTQDMSARFFITDVLRSILSRQTLVTSPESFARDYIGPADFYQLISKILAAHAANDVVDCYTQAPIEKFVLLESIKERFGLHYRVCNSRVGVNATGAKVNYYSKYQRASAYGYTPSKNSLQNVLDESYIALTSFQSSFQ